MERKEAIEVIKKNWPDSSFTMLREALETLIPELKEDKDEKIRKHLISLFEKFVTLGVANECETSEIKVDDILAWLEKQGEQKPWNEEDMATISRVISIVKWAAYSDHSHPILNDEGATELVERLKSLKNKILPQNSTVTDEELAQAEKDAYNEALDKIEYHMGEPTFDDGWNAAIWYLKKKNAQTINFISRTSFETSK